MKHGLTFVFLVVLGCACRDERVVGATARVRVTEALVFPKTWPGEEARLPLVVESIGTAPVRVLSLQAESPEIRLDSAEPRLLPGGTSMTVNVRWTPVRAAPLATRIVVATDAPEPETLAVAVSGEVGVVLDCDDGNACTDDRFDRASGTCEHRTERRPCDDGNACTRNDTCGDDGLCVGIAFTCDDGDGCTTDLCDAEAGCVHLPVEVDCEDGNPCTRDVCDDVAGCAHPPVADGTTCGALTCAAAYQCVQGSCRELPLGDATDGIPCDDGDVCTEDDACRDGRCTGSASPACACSVPPIRPGTTCATSHDFAPLDLGNSAVWDGRVDDASSRDCLSASLNLRPGLRSEILGEAAVRFVDNPGGDFRFAFEVPCPEWWCHDRLLEAWDFRDVCAVDPYPQPNDCTSGRAETWPSRLVFSVYRVGYSHPHDGYRLEVSYR